jgi:DNA-binding MarR family transcriptional regulator
MKEPALGFVVIRRSTGFTQLANHILLNPNITCQEFRVYSILCYHAGQDFSCFIRQKIIAKEAGVSTRQIQRAVRGLEKKGLLSRLRRGLNRCNIYYINEMPHVTLANTAKNEADTTNMSHQDTTNMSHPVIKKTVGNNKDGGLKKFIDVKRRKLLGDGYEAGKTESTGKPVK